MFEPVLIQPRRATMTAAGLWGVNTVNTVMSDVLRTCPDKPALIAYRSDALQPTRLTYRELDDRATRAAQAFRSLGVGRFDVISIQLPNWWEFTATLLACAKLGAVASPLMPMLRERELTFMLEFAESKLLIVPKLFRGFDYEEMARAILPRLDHRLTVVPVGGDGDDSYERLLTRAESSAPLPRTPLAANDVVLMMYTSGTTGEPKGVMHTSNTLFAGVYSLLDRLELHQDDVVLGSTLLPLVLKATSVLQDDWEAGFALNVIHDEGITFSMASTPFLSDLCDVAERGAPASPTFRKVCCSGAPIPPALIERADRMLGLTVCSAWGMTETGLVTVTEPSRALELSGVSAGRPLSGMEVKVVDDSDSVVPVGVTGSLLVRGPSLFGGYYKRPELNNTDLDGWFDTGDLAVLDAEGYIRIRGRSKDIVNRGGEEIAVFEIENLLCQHPSIAAAAIVGYPDERLGERACAFVELKRGVTLTLDEINAYLTDCQVTESHHPERLEVVADLPRTPSGKIQRFQLREQVKHDAGLGNARERSCCDPSESREPGLLHDS
jgi:cyclohexanecarboxylate-CoA ligase